MTKNGKIRRAANAKLKEIYLEKEITQCEVQLSRECAGYSFLSFAHRHKRNWYLGRMDRLSEFRQTILACVPCHIILEMDAELTEEAFLILRGGEEIDCPACEGTGNGAVHGLDPAPCGYCNGTGKTTKE